LKINKENSKNKTKVINKNQKNVIKSKNKKDITKLNLKMKNFFYIF